MSPPKFHDDDFDHQRSVRNVREINGPRPSPLKINKDSHVIHKLPSSSSNSLLLVHNNKQEQEQDQQRRPVIIYAHSPKVIHTQPRDFMALVQKLTGSDGNHEAAPRTQKAQAVVLKKPKQMPRLDHDHHEEDSDHDQKLGGGTGDCGGADSSISTSPILKAPTNPFLADVPLFTPTASTDFFCSPKPMFRFPESMYASPINSANNPISPSLFEFIKGLPEC
ncbi:hypothetical protein KPL70_004529 [Citrus sinensis]|uniref:protein MKS1-like n=1 Tax=Citrus sinensis TaxID=2711 RepID=UPI0003D71388|nr:protein MKS1-like [Citrus sinensis]KAH9746806.1 hypothetical protein KPL70_004529 [Citrus sinensis]